MADTITITKLTSGNVQIDNTAGNGRPSKSLNPAYSVMETPGEDGVIIYDSTKVVETIMTVDVLEVVREDGTTTTISDTATLFTELSTFFFS